MIKSSRLKEIFSRVRRGRTRVPLAEVQDYCAVISTRGQKIVRDVALPSFFELMREKK